MMDQNQDCAEKICMMDVACYKTLIEDANDIILVLANDGRILFANRAASAVYGYSRSELQGMQISELRSPETHATVGEQFQKAKNEGIVFRTIHLRKNGEPVPVEVSSRKVRFSDGEVVFSIIRDISAILKMETLLKENEEHLWRLNSELAIANEKLTASEEELRQQLDELLQHEESINRQNHILSALHEAALGLMQSEDVMDILNMVAYHATEMMGTPHGYISLVDEEKGEFVRKVGLGYYAQDIGRSIKITDGLVGQVYKTGSMVIVEDYSTWENRLAGEIFDNLHAVVQVPLKAGNKVIGTFGVAFLTPERSINDQEVSFLLRFADLASIAVRNATSENALRAAEEKYQSIFDNAVAGIFQTTANGSIISVNSAMARMLGYASPDDAVDSIHDIASQVYVDAEQRQRYIEQIRQQGHVENYEAQFYRKDRVIIWVEMNSRVVYDPQGEVLCIEGTCIDITERKKAEEERQEQRAKLEQLVEERTQSLLAANQELTALNEEMAALNETLENSNQNLEKEIDFRQQVENELVVREQQYRATMNLVTSSDITINELLADILRDALTILKAPGGYVGLQDETGEFFVIRHAFGTAKNIVLGSYPVERSMFSRVRQSGEMLYVEDYGQYLYRVPEKRLDQLKTLIMFPLKHHGQVIGAFCACWTDEIHQVVMEELEILSQYGNLASIALERTNNQEEITRMAYHDPLTGLPNRASLNRHLDEEMNRARRGEAVGSILFVDLDDLKMVNDNFGHTFGDGVIIAASRHILDAVGKDAFVARMGGDEFIVVLAGENQRERIAKLADCLVKTLHGEYEISGKSLHMSASIGVTLYPEDADSVEELLRNADNAMYAAKATGRNGWRFYEPAMLQDAYEKMVVTNNLRRALEREEMFLQYQPLIDLRCGKVISYEALIRWNSREHGMMSPARFIPLAEQSGLIQPIGEWVIKQACSFARTLSDMGRGSLRVSINVSPRQLAREDFVSLMREKITDAGIQPGQLQVEITESVLIDSLEDSVQKLNALDELGIGLSLDDFGTGYSSLTYLRRLPVKTLKIDKSFVDSIIEDQAQEGFIESIIDMAHVLGLDVVAEGVETEAQLAKLKELGCDYAQGYFISRPVAEEEALRFLLFV